MTVRKPPEQPPRRDDHRKADEAAAARQRARDRAGDDGLPRGTGAPKRRRSAS
jgi:hypothetical protein